MITPALIFWWRLFATLAMEVCCLAALGFAAQRLTASAFWRRAAWQITVVCLLAAAVSEWTGVGRAMAMHFAPRQKAVQNALAPRIGLQWRGNPIQEQVVALPSPPPEKPAGGVWWPGLIALTGTVLLLGRTALAQGLLLALRFGRNKISEDPLLASLARLSPRLGLRREVCLRRMSALVSPMAFGILRPCIGLPAQFETRFSPAEQEAVLAHELAHLAARDPLWFLLADLAVAVLWWHPAAWWARQRLHVISEQAADEATALVPDGPQALARCLVALGREMANMSAWGWVGINGGGFRSNLGRRVEGLLQLSDSPPLPLQGRGVSAIKIVVMLAAAPMSVLAFGFMQNTPNRPAETWLARWENSWRQSPAGVFLLAKRNEPEKPPATNQVEKTKIVLQRMVTNAKLLYEMGNDEEAEAIFMQVLKDDPSNRSAPYYLDLIKEARYFKAVRKRETTATHNPVQSEIMITTWGKQRILSKLDTIILDKVSYDLPLREVAQRLQDESIQRDPDGIGVKFIIDNQSANVASGNFLPADPSAVIAAVPIGAKDIGKEVMIRISPSSGKMRMADVLEEIIKLADHPICYTVEDSAVVFRPKGAESATLYIKKFRFNPNTFEQALEKALGGSQATKKELELDARGRTNLVTAVADPSMDIHRLVRVYFAAAGVDFAYPKWLFFNDRLGELLVKATLSDLGIIQKALDRLNQSPQDNTDAHAKP